MRGRVRRAAVILGGGRGSVLVVCDEVPNETERGIVKFELVLSYSLDQHRETIFPLIGLLAFFGRGLHPDVWH